jgi:Inhibitor of apoptosis-promoting Bax1
MGLIGVVIASIGSSALQFVGSIVGIIVFVGLTAWDTQSIKEQYADNFDLESKQKLAVIDWRAGRMSSGPSRTLRRQSPSSQLLLLELGGRVPI